MVATGSAGPEQSSNSHSCLTIRERENLHLEFMDKLFFIWQENETGAEQVFYFLCVQISRFIGAIFLFFFFFFFCYFNSIFCRQTAEESSNKWQLQSF